MGVLSKGPPGPSVLDRVAGAGPVSLVGVNALMVTRTDSVDAPHAVVGGFGGKAEQRRRQEKVDYQRPVGGSHVIVTQAFSGSRHGR